MTDRSEQIRHNLEKVRARIADATPAGRPDPELIVITKFYPASDVRHLYDFGVRHVGENRDQEAAPKAQEVNLPDLNWHFVGQLQTNKAKNVVRYASAVHSVDRVRLVTSLQNACQRAERDPLKCLVQIDLDPRADEDRPIGIGPRGGAAPTEVERIAEAIEHAEHLELAGVMAVAPVGLDPAESFQRLSAFSQQIRRINSGADWISAGMSHDLEQALAAGATHLRIGTDVLGQRPSVN